MVSLTQLPGFSAFVAGRVASVLGRQMLAVAIGWELYERTSSVLVLGFVGLVQVLPVVLLALPVGALVDRVDARVVGAVSVAALGAVGVGFAVASWSVAPLWVFWLLLALHGTSLAFHSPAIGAVFPRLVPTASRTRGNAIMSTGFEVASVGGPAVAGLLLSANVGASIIYALHALLSFAFVVVLAVLRTRGHGAPVVTVAAAAHTRGLANMAAGARFVLQEKRLLAVMLLDLFAVLLGGVTALLPVYAKDILEVGPAGLGLLRAAPAVGAILMAAATAALPPWRRPGRALLTSVLIFGAATIGFGLSTSLVVSLALLVVVGAADNVSVIVRATLEHMIVPDAMRGRVAAIRYVFIGMSNELGELESGMAAAAVGVVPAVVIGGVGTLCVAGLVAWRVPALRDLPPLASLAPAQPST